VQFALFRSCGNGKLPVELAGVGVVSQSSPPPAPPLEAPLVLPLDPPPELELPLDPPVEPPPLPLEPVLPLPEPLLLPDEPLPPLLVETPPSAPEGSAGLAVLAQAETLRHPMKIEGRV
jgi:hypothetical protein